MNEWYSARELTGLPGLPGSDRGIQKKLERENARFREVPAPGGPGGKRREYHISSLPEATRIALLSAETKNDRPVTINNETSRTVAGNHELSPDRNSIIPEFMNPENLPARIPTQSLPISPKGRAIALARLDLLRAWQEYRTAHIRATDADREFASAYNAGVLFPALQTTLGPVSVQTLYRWKSALGETRDWTRLVPAYYLESADRSRLSRDEERLFLNILLQPTRVKIGSAIRLLRFASSTQGIVLDKSDMTLRRFAEDYKKRHYDTWVLMREGQKALRDKVNLYIKRDPSLLEVGEVFVADGHRLNFQIINPYSGKPCRATLVGYVDWKSYDLAGYEIMIEENTQCIASALRNSILRLGKLPSIAYQDNGKAFRSRFFTDATNLEEAGIYGLFGRLGIVPVFAQPYNARAKIIERWFREFSDTFERLLPSFTGSSIEDKPARLKRNEPFHKALASAINYVPTINQTVQLISAWHEFHRSQPCPHVKGRTIGEVFDEGRGTGVTAPELDDLMMAIKRTRIDRNGIRFASADYYDENLYGLREEVVIRYSLFDLSTIKVYTLSGEPICTAARVESVHPMAHHLGDVKDMDALKQRLAAQRRNEKKTIQGAKALIALGGRVEMDWQKTIDAAPALPGKLERAGVELPPTEVHIPDEMVKTEGRGMRDEGCEQPEQTNIASLQEAAIDHAVRNRPFFRENYERYEWHLKYGTHTEEDEAWLAWYKTTGEYKNLYEYFEKQAALEAQKTPRRRHTGQSQTL